VKAHFFIVSCCLALSSCNYRESKLPPQPVLQASSGLSAFQETVYAHARASCVQCHSWRQQPLFAAENVEEAYAAAKPYADFHSIKDSTFVYRTKNGHCGNACETDGTHMQSLIRQWWEKGESSQHLTPVVESIFLTDAIALPDLKKIKGGFAKLSWDIRPLEKFEIEVERFDVSSYRFRHPRIYTADRALDVRSIKILIDDEYDPTGNAYLKIQNKVASHSAPLLSIKHQLVPVSSAPQPMVRVSFRHLEEIPMVDCSEMEVFEKRAMPILESRCASCHSKMPASQFTLSKDSEVACRASRQLVSAVNTLDSPLLAVPYLQAAPHPARVISPDEARSIQEWIAAEVKSW